MDSTLDAFLIYVESVTWDMQFLLCSRSRGIIQHKSHNLHHLFEDAPDYKRFLPIITWVIVDRHCHRQLLRFSRGGGIPITAGENRASCHVGIVGTIVLLVHISTKEVLHMVWVAHMNGCRPPLSSPTPLQSLVSNIPPYV